MIGQKHQTNYFTVFFLQYKSLQDYHFCHSLFFFFFIFLSMHPSIFNHLLVWLLESIPFLVHALSWGGVGLTPWTSSVFASSSQGKKRRRLWGSYSVVPVCLWNVEGNKCAWCKCNTKSCSLYATVQATAPPCCPLI